MKPQGNGRVVRKHHLPMSVDRFMATGQGWQRRHHLPAADQQLTVYQLADEAPTYVDLLTHSPVYKVFMGARGWQVEGLNWPCLPIYGQVFKTEYEAHQAAFANYLQQAGIHAIDD